MQELAAVSVDYGADEPVSDTGYANLANIDSNLELLTTIVVKEADEQAVLQALLDRRVAIHKALMADRSLGLTTFVIDTRPAGAAAPDLDVSTDMPAGSLTCRWIVHYRMNLADPS
jgi:hypothetical protein